MRDLIRARKLSRVELVDAHLKQIEKENPRLNAFVRNLDSGLSPYDRPHVLTVDWNYELPWLRCERRFDQHKSLELAASRH
jgi:hypothetical protein